METDLKYRKLSDYHLPKEVVHIVTDEIRRDSDEFIRKKYIRHYFDFSGTTLMGQFSVSDGLRGSITGCWE